MLFNSFEYVIFLPIVFALYWSLRNHRYLQNILLVIVSYIFYGWWDHRFLLLIFFTTLCSYISGVLIDRIKARKTVMWINISVNLLLLGYFKYYNFFATELQSFFKIAFNFDVDWTLVNVILPVGISFYTFQALSYTIDVYNKKISATNDFVSFAAFISFFPQLVAGPIERATNLLPQFLSPRRFSAENITDGLRQILWGLFKKMVIADNCAYIANIVFNDYTSGNSSMLLIGAIAFAFQIYGDFSGYSDIAIGSANLFGIKLNQNFNMPYFSHSIAEFWRRWHISLNTWFIDYVYIPLGGSKCSKARNVCNVLIVFMLSGLWHGANWTFVIWGLYNGILVCMNKVWEHPLSYNKSRLLNIANVIITFSLVLVGWIIFRADSVGIAFDYIAAIFNNSIFDTPNFDELGISKIRLFISMLFIPILLMVEWAQRGRRYEMDIAISQRFVRWAVYLVAIFVLFIFSGKQEMFIYFQF